MYLLVNYDFDDTKMHGVTIKKLWATALAVSRWMKPGRFSIKSVVVIWNLINRGAVTSHS